MSSVPVTQGKLPVEFETRVMPGTKPLSSGGRKESPLVEDETHVGNAKQRSLCWRPEEPRPEKTIEICYAFLFHRRKDLGISPFEETRIWQRKALGLPRR